ncbi:GDSL-type esterase/lipase family protein [Brevundimonas sp. NPDC090276]|uniref:GDSL-type esterase/lipase family protein n=1 Tax=Brevundimonas sp. NPDC090276 TaxID=3363956 RepID=UPI00383A6FDB
MAGNPFSRRRSARPLAALVAGLCVMLGAPAVATAQVWVPAWLASPMPWRNELAANGAPPLLTDVTLRQDLLMASAASAVRIRFSNELGEAPLVIGRAEAGPRGEAAQVLRFDGATHVAIPPGSFTLSDPLTVAVPAYAELTVVAYLPEETRPAVRLGPVRIASGDHMPADDAPLLRGQGVVSAVLAERPTVPAAVIVAIGDSITEGGSTTLGAHRAWPHQLGRRLEETCPGGFVVVNAGIGGNMVVSDGRSPALMSRLERDVLAMPGVTHVVLMAGLNDVRQKGASRDRAGAGVDEVAAGYRRAAETLQAHHIKVVGGVLTPILASPVAEPAIPGPTTDDKRRSLNALIRQGDIFDGVIDFEVALDDPARPGRIRPGAHREDSYHPNDEGHRLMAEVIDADIFVSVPCSPSRS